MQCITMVIIMQRAIVVLVSIHLCSHYYYLAVMISFSSINHGTTTMLHISLSRRSTAAASSVAYDEGGIHGITASIVIIIWSRSAASMVSLVCGATPLAESQDIRARTDQWRHTTTMHSWHSHEYFALFFRSNGHD